MYYDVEIHETFRFQVENMKSRHKYPISSGPPFSNIAIMKRKFGGIIMMVRLEIWMMGYEKRYTTTRSRLVYENVD